MLENLLGSMNKERVLIFLYCREEGYTKEISDFFEVPLTPILNQMNNLENGNVLISRQVGRTRMFQLNPRYPFLKELKNLLEKALIFYPEKERDLLMNNRRRPRKKGKKL